MKSRFLLEERGLRVGEARLQEGFYLIFRFVEFVLREAVDRDVEPEVEQPLLRLLEFVAQLLQIPVCRIQNRIAHEALLLPHGNLGLHLRHFPAQSPEDCGGVHRMHEHGDVKNLVHIDDRAEPVGVQISRIGKHKNRARKLCSKAHGRRFYFKRRGRQDVFERKFPGAVNLLREYRKDFLIRFFDFGAE